jgi:hypothetical protein
VFFVEALQIAQKAVRGSKTKSNVMLTVKSTIFEELYNGKTERQCRSLIAEVLEDQKA